MWNKASKYLLASQISLYGFLTICTLLMPQFLFERDQGGISNFGIHSLTVVPYSLGFGLCAIFILLAANSLPISIKSYSAVKRALFAVAGLCVLAVFSTYT